MDMNLVDLSHIIHACLVLHNFCEQRNETIYEKMIYETIYEKMITAAIQYDQGFQLSTQVNDYKTDSNEEEGKKVKRVITKSLDP